MDVAIPVKAGYAASLATFPGGSPMTRLQKDPLRPLASDERDRLRRIARSHAEPAAHVARAKALLAVADGASYADAAKAAGRRGNDAVSHLVSRFNREGVVAIEPRHGGGPPVVYAEAERERGSWLKEELSAILGTLPEPKEVLGDEENRAEWKSWQEGLSVRITSPKELPPLRMLLVWDNLIGHLNAELSSRMFARGVMVLYTPSGGSRSNMTESIQRILVSRALHGQHPRYPEETIEWLEAVARGRRRDPTPFEWGGRRAERRTRARERRHALGGSGACTRRPLRRRVGIMEKWRCS
jgi:hypothetical protein